jgi:hypothetical protein
MASNTGMVTPLNFDSGGTYDTTLVSSPTLYPFTTPYSVYAGSCSADAPPSADQGSASVGGAAATVPLPALFVNVLAGGGTTAYDDPNAPLTYVGSWTHNTNGRDYNGSESDSNTALNSMNVSFTGTSVSWIGSRNKGYGIANVYLDNAVTPTVVDTYHSWMQWQQTLYSVSGLTNGPHTLKIVVTGTNDGFGGGSKGNLISIDEIIVVASATTLLTAPHVILTDTGCANYKSTPATVAPSPTTGALADPGVPYANLTVCADNGINRNTAVVTQSGLSFTVGTTVSIDLSNGAAGVTSGVCS